MPARPQLSRRDRSIVVITILVWLGAGEELAAHVAGGVNHGLTRVEIEEVVNHLSLYAGFPRAVSNAPSSFGGDHGDALPICFCPAA